MGQSVNLLDSAVIPQRALPANLDTTSFASLIPTITAPANAGTLPLLPWTVGGKVYQRLKVWPIGLGADNDGYSLRIFGWTHVGGGSTVNKENLWWPTLIVEATVLLCAKVGIASSPVLDTERFADTIAIVTQRQFTDRGAFDATTTGPANRGTVEVLSPGSDLIGFLVIPITGFERLEFQVDQTTNTPTGNFLVGGI